MDSETLRQRARTIHEEKPRSFELRNHSVEQIEHLVEELEIHKIELDLQNQELLETQRALQLSSRLYRELFDSAPVGYVTISSKGKILDCNLRAAELFGQSLSMIRGQNLSRFVASECRDQLFLAIRKMFSESLSFHLEATLSAGSETDRTLVTIEASPAPEESTERFGRVILMDITKSRKLQEQAFQARKMESIALLAGGIAHDFNNLMAVVNGCSEILLEELDVSDSRRSLVCDILQSGEFAAELTAQLLTLGRCQRSEPSVLDLNESIRASERLFKRLLLPDVKLDLDLCDHMLLIRAVPYELDQILLNLVVNARDAQPEGGKVIIRTGQVDDRDEGDASEMPSGPCAGVWVIDQGAGIPVEIQSRIFEPFFTTREKNRGTGLGLSTVYSLVQKNQAHISFVSRLECGTSFSIRFPLVQQNQLSQLDTSDLDGRREQPLGAKTVLIVDDNRSITRLIERVVTAEGYQVLSAFSGEEALEVYAASSSPVDLLITDVVMPGISGFQLSQSLRRQAPDLPIIFVSGYADDVMLAENAPPGSSFLSKPFRNSEIRDLVRDKLEK